MSVFCFEWKIVVGVLFWPFGIYLLFLCATQKKDKKSEKKDVGNQHINDLLAKEEAQGKGQNQQLGQNKKSFNQMAQANDGQQQQNINQENNFNNNYQMLNSQQNNQYQGMNQQNYQQYNQQIQNDQYNNQYQNMQQNNFQTAQGNQYGNMQQQNNKIISALKIVIQIVKARDIVDKTVIINKAIITMTTT